MAERGGPSACMTASPLLGQSRPPWLFSRRCARFDFWKASLATYCVREHNSGARDALRAGCVRCVSFRWSGAAECQYYCRLELVPLCMLYLRATRVKRMVRAQTVPTARLVRAAFRLWFPAVIDKALRMTQVGPLSTFIQFCMS
eukprot:6195792-Pleurochrysis_carterae.AAC.7